MKWLKDAKEGIVVAGGNGQGNSLTQLSYPRGVIVDQLGQIYVADGGNDRVVRWCKGAKEGTIVVGGNGKGEQSNQLNTPRGLSFDRQGNLYVVDCGNHRIQKFEVNYIKDKLVELTKL
jgi:DNA-binding beta-propeller fold protein YncE